MRFVFLGTTEFSATLLTCLLKRGFRPALVVCNPDRPFGRKKLITPPPSKRDALEASLPVFQPENLDHNAEIELANAEADFFVLADYGKIIPPAILRLPRLGIIGVHVSLLPKYRGPSPMQSAILNGEKETGVSLYLLDEKIDHGPLLAQTKFALDNRTFLELRGEGARLACELLTRILPEFAAGKITPQPQDETLATYTRRFTLDDGFVDPQRLQLASSGKNQEEAESILRKIRALNPEPGVWTTEAGKRVKLLEAEIQDSRLILKRIQIEGEKPKSL